MRSTDIAPLALAADPHTMIGNHSFQGGISALAVTHILKPPASTGSARRQGAAGSDFMPLVIPQTTPLGEGYAASS